MQAPEDSAALGSVYPPEPSGTAPSPRYQWLDSSDIGISSGQSTKQHTRKSSHWQWQVGGALTGTAVVSAGLAMPFSGEQAIGIPIGETYFPPAQTIGENGNTPFNRQTAQTVAFSQGQGINPDVNTSIGRSTGRETSHPQQALFTQSTQGRFSPSALSATSSATSAVTSLNATAYAPTPAVTPTQAPATSAAEPQLVMDDSGSWTLSYTDTAATAANPLSTQTPLSTQAVVNQIIAENRAQLDCSGSSACRSLEYIQAQLPEARQNAQALQQQLAEFEAQHGQSNVTAYKTVLSKRISEITGQKTEIAIELSATRHYVTQVKSRLATIEVAPDLAAQLLAVDDDYQTHWQRLQQTERQLREEYSQASIDATALNQIYNRYEQQQLALYQSAQGVLGNYLLSSGNQDPNGRASGIYIAPAALDLLQSLIVATHEQDVQQLRDRTVNLATERLQTRHRQLAQNISEYEALQREFSAAQALVTQYEGESARISAQVATAQATASTLVATTTAKPNTTASLAPAFATAKALESKFPEGSIGKTLLGIVIAAGAVAVAAQRRAGNVSEALALEIAPRPQPKRFGLMPKQKRMDNPVQPDLLAELLEMTGQLRPAFALPEGVLTVETPSALPYLRPAGNTQTNRPAAIQSATIQSAEKANTQQLPAAADSSNSQAESASPVQNQPTEEKADPSHSVENQPVENQPVENQIASELMTRELEEIITQSTPEVRFAREISQRNLEPVKISLDELDAFAESAVRWVLHDLDANDSSLNERERETVTA